MMRHLFLIIVACVVAMSCPTNAEAKNRTLDKPEYIYRNTEAIDVSRLTLSDTATVLHIYTKGRAKSKITIAKSSYLIDNNGKRYPIRSGIGIEIGKDFVIPQSGNAIFQLVFPPIDAGITTVSFSEGDNVEGGWTICGIQAKNGKLPKLKLPKGVGERPLDTITPLPESVMKYGTATLRGHILEYLPEMKNLEMYAFLRGTFPQELTKIDVNPDGTFRIDIDVAETTVVNLYVPKASFTVFLQAGDTTDIWINTREIARTKSKYHRDRKASGLLYYVNGPLANVAQETTPELMKKYLGFKIQDSTIVNMNLEEYKPYVQKAYDELRATLAKEPLSLATKQYWDMSLQLLALQATFNAPASVAYASVRMKKATEQDAMAKSWDLRREAPKDYFVPTAKQWETLNSTQASLSPTLRYIAQAKRGDLYRNNNLFTQRCHATEIYGQVKDNYVVLNDSLRQLVAQMPQSYQTMIENVNAKTQETIAANKLKTGYTVCEVPDVENDSLFNAIIAPYKGKVVLVDFWATWCGPCKNSIKHSQQLREDYKDRVAFVFLTGETSPKQTWENMITDISGYHYRVSAEQWKFLMKNFKVSGIPFYVLVDKNGNIAATKLGYISKEEMKSLFYRSNCLTE